MDAFEDLSVEDKAKVIGGSIAVGVAILGFLVFIQLFGSEFSLRLSEDLKSGSSIFTTFSFIITAMYFFTFFPMIVAAALAMGLLAKRSLGYAVKDILAPALLVTGSTFFFAVLLLSLFGVLFSNLSEAVQAILVIFAFFVSSIVTASVLKTKRFNRYLKRTE